MGERSLSPLSRSLVARTVALVGGVVLLLGAAVVLWITAEDRRDSVAQALRLEEAAEAELRSLAADLVRDHQEIAVSLVEGADRRTREWMEEEPLALYRDRTQPDRVDVDALRRALTAELRARSRAEKEHVGLVAERLGRDASARVDRVAEDLRSAGRATAAAAADDRRARLALRLGLLLAGLSVLLGIALWSTVIAPVRRLRSAVDRIAAGDLKTPVPLDPRRADEIGVLARDVERMRDELARATAGLEAEVARKTADLARTLSERTAALEQLEAAKDRLVQAAKMASLGTLAGGVAHEFNNLLGGILGCVESARAEVRDPSVAEDLDMVRRTAQRGLTLVRGMLDVARPGSRDFAEVDLSSLLDDAVRTASPVAERRSVAIRRETAPVPSIRGDAAQLHQVALNLLTNALQAVDDGEEVVVALRREGRDAVLEVRDAGSGVDPAIRDRIFEPFFTGRDGGTGLGLFVSYGIVERHGGRIEVGDAPEGGARFTVRLPIAGPAAAGGAPSGPGVAPGGPATHPRPDPSA
jgi:signal transduction histidine kinase